MTGALISMRVWLTTAFGPRDDERGASLVEYALLVALIAIVCFAAVGILGDEAASRYENTGSSFAENRN